MGQKLQEKVISEVGENAQNFTKKVGVGPTGKRAEAVTREAFQKLGIAPPPRKRRRRGKRGRGFVYPQALLSQFTGNGIILE